MSSKRRLWPIAFVLVALVGMAGAGAWFWLQLEVAKAAAALHTDALAMANQKLDRPSHAAPALKGTFGACAEPRLGSAVVEVLKDEPDACKAFRAPKASPGKIPDECLAIVTPRNGMAWARGLMSCARAETAGLPEGILTPGHKLNALEFTPWVAAAKVLAWEIRSQAASQQYAAALETCADVLATARDLNLGGAVLGSMGAASAIHVVFPACADAVAGADEAARAKFRASLDAINSAPRTNAQMLREDNVEFGLTFYGYELDAAQRDSLPKELKARIKEPKTDSIVELKKAQWKMIKFRAARDDVTAISDLPDAERTVQLAKLKEKHAAVEGTAFAIAEHEKLLRKADQPRTLVQLLGAAAGPTAPVATTAFTVTPVEGGGVELVPVDPELAKYSIQVPAR